MKCKFYALMLLISTLTSLSAKAQADYVPMVVDGMKWTYFAEINSIYTSGSYMYNIELRGTTDIDGKIYANVYRYRDDVLDTSRETPVAYIREENKKVYGRLNPDYKCDYIIDSFLMTYYDDEEVEKLLYDFENVKNTPLFGPGYDATTIVTEDGICRNMYVASREIKLIDGLGLDYYGDLLNPVWSGLAGGDGSNLAGYTLESLAYVTNPAGQVIYKGLSYGKKPYVPMLANGCKWTYFAERNVWNYSGGYYYTIEFGGWRKIGDKYYMDVYRYVGDKLDTETMVPAAFVREEDRKIYGILNKDYKGELGILENLSADGETLLYDFANPENNLCLEDGYSTSAIIAGDDIKHNAYTGESGCELIEGFGLNKILSDLIVPNWAGATDGAFTTGELARVYDYRGIEIFKGSAYGKEPYLDLLPMEMKWTYYADYIKNGEISDFLYHVEIKGLQEINGVTYRRAYRYKGDLLDTETMQPAAYLRQDGRKIYGILNRDYQCEWNVGESLSPDEETLLYDFDAPESLMRDGCKRGVIVTDDCMPRDVWAKEGVETTRKMINGIGIDEENGWDLLNAGAPLPTGEGYVQVSLSQVTNLLGTVIYKGMSYGRKPAGVEDITGDVEKEVRGVRYYNMLGVESTEPFSGVNVKVTTYSDGTRSAEKVLK